MVNRERLRKQLELHEGIKLKAYKCTAGKWTIGVGYNIDAHGLPFGYSLEKLKTVGITPNEAAVLLDREIDTIEQRIQRDAPWMLDLSEVRLRALIDMAFNLGFDGLLAFKNTLKAVEAGLYDVAAAGMLASKWAKQVKGRAARLARMMRTGEDSKDF